jgi:hypothetical protein
VQVAAGGLRQLCQRLPQGSLLALVALLVLQQCGWMSDHELLDRCFESYRHVCSTASCIT